MKAIFYVCASYNFRSAGDIRKLLKQLQFLEQVSENRLGSSLNSRLSSGIRMGNNRRLLISEKL